MFGKFSYKSLEYIKSQNLLSIAGKIEYLVTKFLGLTSSPVILTKWDILEAW